MKTGLMGIMLSVCLLSQCMASNSYFIPGDAFFYFEIDKAEWEQLEANQIKHFDYDRPEELSFAFCGYVGYKRIDASSMSKKLRMNFVNAVSKMKKSFPSKIVEIDHGDSGFLIGPSGIESKEVNKIRVFVTNRSFDFQRYRIGLKYNERWETVALEMGFKKKHFKYDFFVPTSEGMEESRKLGMAIAGLQLRGIDPGKKYDETPLKFASDKVSFVVCPPVALSKLAYPKPEDKVVCYVASESGIEKLTSSTARQSTGIWRLSR